MATLLELSVIEANANSSIQAGEPPEVAQARNLLQKIRSAAIKSARAILADATPLPATEPARTAALEQIAWARQTVQSPEQAAAMLLRLALAANAGAPPSAILAADDAAIEGVIPPLIPLLAKGLQLVR